ncbi:MAG TPA: Rdx family protein [Candidatus Angelobacter sp.]
MSLQKAAEQKFGIKPKIKTGKTGDLTVWVDGKSVFGYKAEGQMPETASLLGRIEAAKT